MNIKSHIFNKATSGIWKLKNNQDHIVLKKSWIKKRFLVALNVLYADIDIKRYRIGQTIPNTYPGGLSSDFKRDWYHISVDVFEEAKPPNTKARGTKKKIESLLFKNKTYLFLKNLDTVDLISAIKVDPLGLASIKI